MTIVVDASAVGAMLFNEPEGATIRAHVRDESLVAPELIDYELANICMKRMRRYQDESTETLALLEGLQHVPIARIRVPPRPVAELAAQTNLSAYDAAYLWLALSRGAELVTLDRRLADVNERMREAT
jgi:predicted nucleic acid-binding protein